MQIRTNGNKKRLPVLGRQKKTDKEIFDVGVAYSNKGTTFDYIIE